MTPGQPPREPLSVTSLPRVPSHEHSSSAPPMRPLASVDIPLLREQRSAIRNKRLGLLGVGIGVLLAIVGSSYALLREPRQEAPEPPAPAIEQPAPPPEAAPAAAVAPASTPRKPEPELVGPAPRMKGRFERVFGKSLSFGDALLKAGLANDETNAVISALTGSFDFRRAHPGDAMIIERGEDGRLERFEYRSSPTLRYEAVRNEIGGFSGHPIQLSIETRRIARGGYVEGQLGDALEGMKLGRALTGLFADVLSSQVHFSTETRKGDTFRVIADEEYVDGAFLRYGTVYALEYRGEKAGTARAFFFGSKSTQGDFFDEQGRALQGGWLRTPLRYDHISSGFGVRYHPILKRKLKHDGIDYAAASGTPVQAAAAGTVRTVGNYGANGNLIAIVHPHGYETFYAHLSRFVPGIKPGTRVKQRQPIAYVGSTGRSTGPHLHFALKRGGSLIDPKSQLNGPGLPLSARELPEYRERVRALSDELAAIELERPVPVAPAAPDEVELDEDEL